MKPRNTLIVVAVAVVLVAYVVLVESPLTPEQLNMRLGTPTVTPAPYMFQLDASQVQTITITDLQVPRVVTAQRTDSGWRVTQPEDKPGDKNKLDSTASALTSLQFNQVITGTDPAFGLNPAGLEARVVMKNGAAYAILLGKKTFDGNGYYIAYTGDQSKTFIIGNPLGDSLRALLDAPPFEPTPMPTPTATPPVTPTLEPTAVPPGFVPTLLPPPAATPKP